jgi:DNA-directed RNA polymerase specialized sigma24 family protein
MIPEGPAVWAGCLRRAGAWRVPPHWSSCDWLEEMQAQGAAAACQALGDFDPERGVPWTAFARQRVLSSLRTRHRQEWSYAVHCGKAVRTAALDDPPDLPSARGLSVETLKPRLARLADVDRRLLERLYWEGCTEADLAAELGIAQSTVNKRKRSILLDLRRTIGNSSELL